MRTFINYLLTISLFIVVIITITILTITGITSKESTRTILDNIDYDTVIEEIKNTDYGIEIYNYANEYGITEEQIDTILQSDEAKDYINEILQQGIEAYLYNGTLEISEETKELITSANETYNLNLEEEQIEELQTYTSDIINDSINTNNDENESSGNQLIIDIIKFCNDEQLHTTLFIIIAGIIILLFASSFKKKNFLEYIGIVSITVAVSTLLFNGLLSLISSKVSTLANTATILEPITSTFYIITFIGIILGIVLLVIQHFINKQVNKEEVPF